MTSLASKNRSVSAAIIIGVAVICEGTGCGDSASDEGGRHASASSISGSDASASADPAGVCTKYSCAPPQPGDCALSKCADYHTNCAYGTMTHVRCVPDPWAGAGSAPADQCYLIGDCSNERMPAPDAGTPCAAEKCGPEPSCVLGTPTNLECIQWPANTEYCAWNYRCE